MPSVSKLIWIPMSHADALVSKWTFACLKGAGAAGVAGAKATAASATLATAAPRMIPVMIPVLGFMAISPCPGWIHTRNGGLAVGWMQHPGESFDPCARLSAAAS
jgi:hypothetical protein